MRYTVTLDGGNLILELTIKFYRRHRSSQPIAKVRAQKQHMKYVMNTIQPLALQIHTMGSFTDVLGNHKGSAATIAQVTAALNNKLQVDNNTLSPMLNNRSLQFVSAYFF